MLELGGFDVPGATCLHLQEAGRPIRYPARIAPTLQELMSSVDGVMAELRQTLQQHMAAAVKHLRVQVKSPFQRPTRVQACTAGAISAHSYSLQGRSQNMSTPLGDTKGLLLVQVVQAYRLLERVPAATMQLLTQHLLQLSGDQRQQLMSGFVAQRQQLARQLEQHKHSLHPSMLSVARCDAEYNAHHHCLSSVKVLAPNQG